MSKPVRALSLLILLSSSLAIQAAEFTPPVRQGVDIYNTVGSHQRLIGFMKIGADKKDLRYLAYLSARISHKPLPRAFLAGNFIYFKGLDQPLTVVDLKRKIFSFNGKRIDLSQKGSVEARMAHLEKIVFPRRSASILWDWIFPYAFAASNEPTVLSLVSGVLAVGGLTTSAQCLAEKSGAKCTNGFMGQLAAVGAVGGLRGGVPATEVFCSPDFRGGQKFVVAGPNRNLVSVSEAHGLFESTPPNLQMGSLSFNNAAAELVAACKSPGALTNMNIALAYPADATLAPQNGRPVQSVAAQPATSTRAPASITESGAQGGTAR
jgi:hypothetical protein